PLWCIRRRTIQTSAPSRRTAVAGGSWVGGVGAGADEGGEALGHRAPLVEQPGRRLPYGGEGGVDDDVTVLGPVGVGPRPHHVGVRLGVQLDAPDRGRETADLEVAVGGL